MTYGKRKGPAKDAHDLRAPATVAAVVFRRGRLMVTNKVREDDRVECWCTSWDVAVQRMRHLQLKCAGAE